MSIITSLPPKYTLKAQELGVRGEDIEEGYTLWSGKGGQVVFAIFLSRLVKS